MNITKSESLEYSCAMINIIKQEILKRRFVVSYDIICKLIKHVWKHVDTAFVPEMHAYSHNGACQSKFNPKNIFGIGFEEGEDCERTWAHFVHIAAIASEKPFFCTEEGCGRRFSRSDEVKRHMRKHETDRQMDIEDFGIYSGRNYTRRDSVNLSEHFTFSLPPIGPPASNQLKSAPPSYTTIPILNKLNIVKPRHHSLSVGPETISALKGHLMSRPDSRRSSVTSETDKAVSAFSMLQLQNYLHNKLFIDQRPSSSERTNEQLQSQPAPQPNANSPKIDIKNLLN